MLTQFPYLTACIDEALRLYPPASGTARVARSDCTLCGHSIPKGTLLNVAVRAAPVSSRSHPHLLLVGVHRSPFSSREQAFTVCCTIPEQPAVAPLLKGVERSAFTGRTL